MHVLNNSQASLAYIGLHQNLCFPRTFPIFGESKDGLLRYTCCLGSISYLYTRALHVRRKHVYESGVLLRESSSEFPIHESQK